VDHLRNVLQVTYGSIYSVLASMLAAYWLGAPEVLRAALVGALCCTIADTVLGVTCAFCVSGRRFSSAAFGAVVRKLLVYCCGLLAGVGMDQATGQLLGKTVMFQLTFAVLICVREVSSLLEHSAVLGVPWPDALKRQLDLTRKRVDECLGPDEGDDGPAGSAGGSPPAQ